MPSLKELRARHNLTQKNVAETLGVSVQTYNAWENDFGRVAMRNGKALADLFEVKIDDIFFANSLENISSRKEE